jgi:hypothetical protein
MIAYLCADAPVMGVLLTQTISAWVRLGMAYAGWLTPLAARSGEGEDTIWVQMLVLVILAVFLGIFSIASHRRSKAIATEQAKANKSKGNDLHCSQQKPARFAEAAARRVGKTFKSPAKKKEKDLSSGMELLGLDFLLNVVENTNGGSDEKDVVMRKLNFKELLRRDKLSEADSNALKTYALNKGNLYDKDIQYEAMKKLAERTKRKK